MCTGGANRFSNTCWVSYNSTLFWHYQPRDSIRFQGWGLSPIRLPSTYQLQVQLSLVPWQKGFKHQVFTTSSLSSINLLFSSVAQSCPTLCDPMNRSTPGLPVHHQLLKFTQTHHRVSDAIQPSHPLPSPSPPAPNPSQHQSLFQWVNSSHEVASVAQNSEMSFSH